MSIEGSQKMCGLKSGFISLLSGAFIMCVASQLAASRYAAAPSLLWICTLVPLWHSTALVTSMKGCTTYLTRSRKRDQLSCAKIRNYVITTCALHILLGVERYQDRWDLSFHCQVTAASVSAIPELVVARKTHCNSKGRIFRILDCYHVLSIGLLSCDYLPSHL